MLKLKINNKKNMKILMMAAVLKRLKKDDGIVDILLVRTLETLNNKTLCFYQQAQK